MPTLRTMTPKKGTPTAVTSCGKKTKIKGIAVWVKGTSPNYEDDSLSPYNERAAYLVDKMLSLNLVPTTVLRLARGRVVSAQKWVNADRPEKSNPPLLRLFDYLISNTDRHSGNWLVEKGGKVWAIDNAYSFRRLDRHEGEGADQDLSKVNKAKLRKRLQSILTEPQKIHKRLDSLIGKGKTGALISRMRQVSEIIEQEEV